MPSITQASTTRYGKKLEIFLFERSSLPDALLVGQRNAKNPHTGTVGAEASIWLSTTPDRSVA